MPDDIEEIAASETTEIVASVAETAAEIIEDKNQQIEILEEINEALIDAAIEKTDNELREEFEARINSMMGELSERLNSCQMEVANLQSEVTRLSTMAAEAQSTAEAAEATAETSLILQALNPSSEVEGDPNQTEAPVNPENQQAPEEPPPLQLRKRRTRLL